jgi:hypothetical protein
MVTFSSDTEVVNSALIKIGAKTLTDLDTDSSREAVVARRSYPVQLDALLRRARWNFAKERVSLAPDGTAPTFGYENRFRLPADLISVIGLYDPNEPLQNYTGTTAPWSIEGRYLLTTDAEAKVMYIKRVTNMAEWDPLFGEALAWLLAKDLAFYLTTGSKYANLAFAAFKNAMIDAKIANAFEGTPEVLTSSEWLDARGTTGPSNFRAGPIN